MSSLHRPATASAPRTASSTHHRPPAAWPSHTIKRCHCVHALLDAAKPAARSPQLPTGRCRLPHPCRAASTAAAQPTGKQQQQAGEWQETFLAACTLALDAGQAPDLVEASFKGRISATLPWRLVVVRPVDLKSAGRCLQFSYQSERQNVVKNESTPEGVRQRMGELLALPFSSVALKTAGGQVLSVQFTRSGKAIVHRSTPPGSASTPASRPSSSSTTAAASEGEGGEQAEGGGSGALPQLLPHLAHDRRKGVPIPPDVPHAFLQRIGLQTGEGRLKADMASKMAQVNDFLKLMSHTGALDSVCSQLKGSSSSGDKEDQEQQQRPLCILDCGCGSSHLTLCTWHYVNNVLGVPAIVRGVDSNAALMQRSNDHCRALGLTPEQASFKAAHIRDWEPDSGAHEPPPDVVLALHACDTATDEALALGVRQRAPLIMAVPCCHQNLHKQLAGSRALGISPLQPMMRQGITKQRLVDLLTDTLRAQLLRLCGYDTSVVEFVSTEHTPRNTLIRATLRPATAIASGALGKASITGQEEEAEVAGGSGASVERRRRAQLWGEYVDLKAFFGGVTPYLETLLVDELRELQEFATVAEPGAGADTALL